MSSDFICPECDNRWSAEADADGLFNGRGVSTCPCGANGRDPNDYGDFVCGLCDHAWRGYGNGGLVCGMVPNCPKCGEVAFFAS